MELNRRLDNSILIFFLLDPKRTPIIEFVSMKPKLGRRVGSSGLAGQFE